MVGVDIAGDELLPLDPKQRQALLKARASGLHLTMHAGESGPPDNVRQVGILYRECRFTYTVEPPNNGHVGDKSFVLCSEVVLSSEVEMYG